MVGEEVAAGLEYESSLSELTFNSKTQINMLTMLDEENVNFAAKIVEVIESHLHKVLTITNFVYSQISACPWGVAFFIMSLTRRMCRYEYELSFVMLLKPFCFYYAC